MSKAGPKMSLADQVPALLPRTLPVGTKVGSYRVTKQIAAGGCGTVYAAVHRAQGHRAAVKVLHPELSSSRVMVQRFLREARIVNQLRHPNVVDIYDLGQLQDHRPYFIMELLEGMPLAALVRKAGPFSPIQTLAYLEPICSALEAAHAAGIVHRDLKPNNIAVVDRSPLPTTVKLLDFGIAKLLRPDPGEIGLTLVGQRMGSLSTMSPEQMRGEPVDARADIYALGVIVYFCLVREYPFEANSAHELQRLHLDAPPPLASRRQPVSQALDEVILRCMEKDARSRFQSVGAFLKAFKRAL